MNGNGLSAVILSSEDASDMKASVVDNTFSGNNTSGTGDAFEAECLDSSTFCLDLESNTNDGTYSLAETSGAGTMRVEQLNSLTAAQPGGAGNAGTVSIAPDSPFTERPTEVADGFCGF